MPHRKSKPRDAAPSGGTAAAVVSTGSTCKASEKEASTSLPGAPFSLRYTPTRPASDELWPHGYRDTCQLEPPASNGDESKQAPGTMSRRRGSSPFTPMRLSRGNRSVRRTVVGCSIVRECRTSHVHMITERAARDARGRRHLRSRDDRNFHRAGLFREQAPILACGPTESRTLLGLYAVLVCVCPQVWPHTARTAE
eukprot:scaffold95258_cov75-Phaeocystis_antarctica.AAC.4